MLSPHLTGRAAVDRRFFGWSKACFLWAAAWEVTPWTDGVKSGYLGFKHKKASLTQQLRRAEKEALAAHISRTRSVGVPLPPPPWWREFAMDGAVGSSDDDDDDDEEEEEEEELGLALGRSRRSHTLPARLQQEGPRETDESAASGEASKKKKRRKALPPLPIHTGAETRACA